MKTDSLVNRLNRRIEEKYPLEIQQGESQEGINIWRGKRILPVDQWLKMTASLEDDKVVFDLRKGFNYFPDSTSEVVFQLNAEGTNEYLKEVSKEEFDKWFNYYLDLLTFKKNPELGHMICKNCLLDPTKDKSGMKIGIHKIVAKVLQKELEVRPISKNNFEHYNHNSKNSIENVPVYPCNVLNYFSCPYECENGVKKFQHGFRSATEYLFEVEQITSLVDISLLNATSMTQSHETIYEIDTVTDTMKEIQTLYNGKHMVMMKWSPIEKGKDRIQEQSIIPVRNKEDILIILKDRDKLAKILKPILSDEDYKVWKDKILNFFERIKDDLDSEFRFKYEVYENKLKHACLQCGEFANIYCKDMDTWVCKNHIDTLIGYNIVTPK